jgi:hypothetical protein
MRQIALSLGLIVVLCGSAAAQVDVAVQTAATGLTVEGSKLHDVAAELPRLDALRRRLVRALFDKLGAGRYEVSEELKVLEKFERYCSGLSAKIPAHHPQAAEIAGWLDANAALVAAYRGSLVTTTPLSENGRLEELRSIEIKLGRSFTGTLAADIQDLRGIAASNLHTVGLQEWGRLVRVESGLGPELGATTADVRVVHEAAAGDILNPLIAVNVGSEGPDILTPVDVWMDLRITGPGVNVLLPVVHRQYLRGQSGATDDVFAINTAGYADGRYKVTLRLVDGHKRVFEASDTFVIAPRAVAAVMNVVRFGGPTALGYVQIDVDVSGQPRVVGGSIAGIPVTPGFGGLLGVSAAVDFQAGTAYTGTFGGRAFPNGNAVSTTVDITDVAGGRTESGITLNKLP